MLDALVTGPTDPPVLADLARGKLRRKLPALRQALTGRFRAHHAFLVSPRLAHRDDVDEAIETVSDQIDVVLAPFAEALARLDTLPGVDQRTAEGLIAELGVDMRVFPTATHRARWAGLCPGHHESAGKHRSGKTRRGNRWLRKQPGKSFCSASAYRAGINFRAVRSPEAPKITMVHAPGTEYDGASRLGATSGATFVSMLGLTSRGPHGRRTDAVSLLWYLVRAQVRMRSRHED